MNHHSNNAGYQGEGVKAEGWISYNGYGFYSRPDWLGVAEGVTAACSSEDSRKERKAHYFKQAH